MNVCALYVYCMLYVQPYACIHTWYMHPRTHIHTYVHRGPLPSAPCAITVLAVHLSRTVCVVLGSPLSSSYQIRRPNARAKVRLALDADSVVILLN